jgi:cytoskeletal protein RodZ
MYHNQETLGQYLKRERESHRVPVQEIALFVRVNRSLIDALEGDDFDVFTSRSECLRLIKQYTAYLKLNQTVVLRLFGAQWKLTGGVKRYPKLTQFADGDSSPVKSVMLKGKRLIIGQSPKIRVWLSVAVGALIVISALFIDLPDTKREITPPDHWPPSTEIEVIPAKERVPPPTAANAEVRTVSPKQVSAPKAPPPRPGATEGKISPQPKGIRVIGNRDSKRYHLPGMKYYDLVKAYHRVVFQSEKEAIRAGYRRALE